MSNVTDYHTFTHKNMTIAERRKLDVGDIWINEATCNECGDTIRSRNRHDYRLCKCGKTMVDGGSWYARRGGDNFMNNIVSFRYVPKSEGEK